MYRFLWKRFSITRFQVQKCYSVDNLHCLKFLCTISSSFSTKPTTEKASLTWNDLIECCPLSCKILNRTKSSKTPNSVIELLQSSGFSQTHVKAIASKSPNILFLNPQEILKPKICFFSSLGISEFDVANILSKCPFLLTRSLKNHLIPSFESLRTLMGEERAVNEIKRCPFILNVDVVNKMVPNISSLRNNGVPDSQISKMMNRLECVRVLGNTKPDRFNEIVSALLRMGFYPRASSFERAITGMALHKTSRWEEKLRFFQSLGFSRKEVLSMFRRQPIIMEMSDVNTREKIEFYVKRFHWSPSLLSISPNVMMYSLKKRIKPRCSVFQVLVLRNRISRRTKLLSLLMKTDKDFFGTYVIKHMDEIPEVLAAYQGKLEFDEYNFDSGKNIRDLAF